ncbi:transketolase [Erysipelatoclostridium ramosum]|nr:transketolase [Thomasclavelia ramosa]MBV3167533.1 transketolase [Erysipelatoclostridium sp. MSK.23.68]MBV3181782.1 transketolase [Erysipelatoclostridium sp. MSK.23.67]MBV3248530.1 transketolase [Erysipelatoclostridium sp. MSK.23.31]MBV3132758.1 transketolase [Thomasclavelia ramosa]
MPLGSAAAAYILWGKVMKHSGTHRKWVNRDRFILSGGHGSSLLYSLLHLYNYGLTIEDLRQFRQLDSLTPGHPEYGHTVGVEATTGPLGAGMAMATGMAMAQAHLAAIFNRPGYPVFDSFTYVLGGDGCLMEGISSEAFSLAGTLKLEKLIVLYDSNNISIEGSTDIAFREDVQGRMKAFGFDTFTVEDGDDLDEILSAINQARVSQKPAFIEVKTRIGKGCPAKEGKASAHGEPLGEENVRELKRTLGLDEDRTFAIDEEVYLNTAKQQGRSEVIYKIWKDMFDDYLVTYPEMKKLWKQYFEVDYNKVLENDVEFWKFENKPESTRNLSGTAMNRIKELFPNFMGGSADLAPSTKTYLNKVGDFSAENYRGRNLHYGVREQAMTGIGNGIMLYGGLKTFVSTFFVFSDYVKPMARLSALMNLPLIYVLTHDSIGVGEDGPTHEPVEQLTMLRAMPNFNVFRPCDAQETNAGWYLAMTSKTTPTALVLSRQNLPQIKGSSREALKGGYVIDECEGTPEIIIIASGSEVTLAVEAKKRIRGKAIRVVSMPSMDIFKQQSREYRESILPPGIEKRIAIEAGSRMSWGEFVGLKGKYITMDSFGASAPANELFKRYGFTVDNVVKMINKL